MSKPLLEIRVDEDNSVPVVFYKGEEISNKISIHYDWVTRTEVEGQHELVLKYYDKDDHEIKMINFVRDGQ
ncbi:hypothetical protein [Virgibacillus salexigens]|uniref:Uncharacterized protein n=1 Tax=Virgibacillus kapii TaxID=1638645 RepID=A0ABQ2DMF3_9BACI|nr:hypothetical protein [Virgibacillus kapii]GGJ61928.1 hypothetical protein GCM10007111_25040 [Virgibacillus kapii]